MIKTILFKTIRFTKNLFIIKRLIALVFLLFGIYMFMGDLIYMSQSKSLEPIKAKDIVTAEQLDKYMLISDYKIDCNYPFAVNKVFKKDKLSHYYLPLVSPSDPKTIIALVQENKVKDSLVFATSTYSNEINLPQNYFEKDIESKLLNGEKAFYESQGFKFSKSFLQLTIDTPPTAFYGILIATLIGILLFLLLLVSFIPSKILNKWFDRYTGVDYTFGVKAIKKIIKSVQYGKYDKALNHLQQLDADQRTQAVDALALMLSAKQMTKWGKTERNSPLFKLIEGSRMVYEAWERRGYAYADETSAESAMGFIELLEKAETQLAQVQGALKIEANAILIRVHKGLSDEESSKRAFETCIIAEPRHTMAHLAYLDVILPKWLGSADEVEDFLKTHKSKSEFLGYILEAKWLFEKVQYNEDEDYTTEVIAFLNANEAKIKDLKTDNPNKFILYNYVFILADEAGNKRLSKRYQKKVKDYLSPTLYSPLRSEKEIKEKLG